MNYFLRVIHTLTLHTILPYLLTYHLKVYMAYIYILCKYTLYNIIWHSISTFFLAYALTFYLASILTFFLASILAFYLTAVQAFILAFIWHLVWHCIWHLFRHSFLSLRYGVRVLAHSTASWASDMALRSRHTPQRPQLARKKERKKERRKERKELQLCQNSRDPHLAVWQMGKNWITVNLSLTLEAPTTACVGACVSVEEPTKWSAWSDVRET